MLERIILDTDIGTDVDDAMAVTLSAISPELKVEGITTVHKDTVLRARMVKKILYLLDRTDIPVYAGINEVLLRNRELWWLGHEGEGLLTEDDKDLTYESEHAVDFIIRTVMENPGEINLVPIGPLTNIAISLIREPRLAKKVKRITIMGGVARMGKNASELDYFEHNASRDPESTHIVYSSGAPITMVGLDVTRQVMLKLKDVERLESTSDELNLALAHMIRRWLEWYKHDYTAMNDPLAVAMVFDPSFCKTIRMKIHVEYDHRHPTGQTIPIKADDANVDICLEVDSGRFIKMLLDRICTRPNLKIINPE